MEFTKQENQMQDKPKDPVLDIIETADHTYIGIVDFVSTKHVIMYDFSNNNDVDCRLLAITHKMYYPGIRFSVFKSLYANHMQFDRPVLINRKLIKYSSVALMRTQIKRNVTKVKAVREDS